MISMDVVKLYGFGSFFQKKIKYGDIDFLIIHSSSDACSYKSAIKCKKIMVKVVLKRADVVMMSLIEEEKNSFISKSHACFLGDVSMPNIYKDLVDIFIKEKIPFLIDGNRNNLDLLDIFN